MPSVLLRECDPYLLRTFLTAAAYEGRLPRLQQARANSEKYDCNIPWIVLMDPTSACNMRCAGCWAAEYGYKQNLTFEEMDRVLTEGAALGTHACLFTGGEPLMRKADIFRLCEKHRDIAFHAFTNGTLIDQAFCDELKRVGNFIVSVSIEGFEDANDGRRGAGHFEKGARGDGADAEKTASRSACPSATRVRTTGSSRATSSSTCSSQGCYFAWYFHYMPVGMGAATDLLLTPEQRAYMKDRVRDPRSHRRQGDLRHRLPERRRVHERLHRRRQASTATSTPRATSSPASSSTTPARTSAKRAFWNASDSLCSWSTAGASPSTITCCAPARCWKTPSACPRWSSAPAHISTDLEAPEALSTCAISAMPTPRAGSRRLKTLGAEGRQGGRAPFRSSERAASAALFQPIEKPRRVSRPQTRKRYDPFSAATCAWQKTLCAE